MNLQTIDWMIIATVIGLLVLLILWSGRYTKSVADYIASGRSAGRYLICVSSEMAGFGALSIIAFFQIYYEAGFTAQWWQFATLFIQAMVAMSGWAVYRFRETRAMTVAEFFEMRYTRNFRVFSGILGWLCGIVNFGIFPGVAARFLIYFCGLPHSIQVVGLELAMFPLLMIFLLAVSLFFTFVGGQTGVMLTDYLQGLYMAVTFLVIFFVVLNTVSWSHICEALAASPVTQSRVNPFQTSEIKTYNVWYYVIIGGSMLYANMAWQGAQGYRCAAKSAHELKMANVLSQWRRNASIVFVIFLALCAYTVMNHESFTELAQQTELTLSGVENPNIVSQLRTPVVLQQIFPVGIMGAFVALMCCALISTYDSYMHSWGCIFVQDVVLPFRKKAFKTKTQLLLIRLSTIFVAVFSFFFSMWFQLADDIWPFLAASGAIYIGGAGSVILGGLYWKKGTTAGAWGAMFTGATMAFLGIILQQVYPDFPFHGLQMYGFSILASIIVYVILSLLTCKKNFNLEKMLHRGPYSVEKKDVVVHKKRNRFLQSLGVTDECTLSDKVLIFSTFGWTAGWFLVFIVGTLLHYTVSLDNRFWVGLFSVYLWSGVLAAVIIFVVLVYGGYFDIKYLLKKLSTMKRDFTDDGRVLKKDAEDSIETSSEE